MKEANPKLILLRTSGFGQTGPYAKKAGFGTVVEAMSGFTSINGEKGATLPYRHGTGRRCFQYIWRTFHHDCAIWANKEWYIRRAAD